MMTSSAQSNCVHVLLYNRSQDAVVPDARYAIPSPSFQQTNEAGDAETLQWDIDLMDVQFLPH
ncbi:MAG: hypothetical protein OXD43_07445 [Bacteroidetes bacterium]|nr:hypothetical protein [Bacteroidota bacterium]